MKRLVLLLLLLLCIDIASAAVIHGTVYDLELNQVDNVLVEINTEPQQKYLARNGTYTFSVPLGQYKISAKTVEDGIVTGSTIESFNVKDDGDYVFDLFLFPDFEAEDELLQDTDTAMSTEGLEEDKSYLLYFIIGALFIIALAVIFLFFKIIKKPAAAGDKKNKAEEEKFLVSSKSDLDKVIEILKKNDSRMTQKDLRKHIPLSEAKVSLLIAVLESKGKIKKIKKGRGNILILE